MSKTIVLRPRVSEKSYGLSETANVYVFEVPVNANKLSIAGAVKSQFEVTVLDVNIANVKGKAKRTISQKGRRVVKGRQSDFKKAYVTLKKGDEIAVFKSAEEPEAKTEPKRGKK